MIAAHLDGVVTLVMSVMMMMMMRRREHAPMRRFLPLPLLLVVVEVWTKPVRGARRDDLVVVELLTLADELAPSGLMPRPPQTAAPAAQHLTAYVRNAQLIARSDCLARLKQGNHRPQTPPPMLPPYSKRPKSSPVRPLACNRYYCVCTAFQLGGDVEQPWLISKYDVIHKTGST